METVSSVCEFNELDSSENTKLEELDEGINDFNLNDFYKCVKLNQLKKNRSEASLLNDNASGITEKSKCDVEDSLNGKCGITDEMSKNMLSYKRSRLLSKIGGYKAVYPDKMGIVEYLLHSYVILFCPNPVTLYSYEAVFKNMSPDSDEFWNTLRTLTSVQLDVDNYPNQLPAHISLLLEESNGSHQFQTINNSDAKKLDAHFTWLCRCCINVTGSKSDDYNEDSPVDSIDKRYSDEFVSRGTRKKSPGSQLTLNNVLNDNYDLSSDVLYEAIRQRGNRYLQRSLYSNVKNIAGLTSRGINPNVAAKITESNGRMKRFMDIIHESSIDSSDPSLYNNYYDLFGDERRHSSRRSIMMRKKYS
ncbi:uncharacterized protein TA08915 [Theileria annulata]|uniref:Uncharacterized protein n=1 Tax=Theileria annulata TaxID=5874 RepID=Q4U9E1_THEAN|nr:uncharacterized protein TA08915 [Theileria annulata]CAI76562.1 hypothetical protein TA08915 [Theileria annulata]|eukprot:XP_953187.1 hypothetical protein TA08915 [Theileria annulata]